MKKISKFNLKKIIVFSLISIIFSMIFLSTYAFANDELKAIDKGINSLENSLEEIKIVNDKKLINKDNEEALVGAVIVNNNIQMTHTKDEIKKMYKEYLPALTEDIMFSTQPVTVGPNYLEGSLSTVARTEVLGWINFYRYLAGVNSVTINEETMQYNAAGAVLLKASNFDHNPNKPQDMSDEFYKKAIQGTRYPENFGEYGNFASGNIAAGTTLVNSIDDWITDVNSTFNESEHRFSLLSPSGLKTSFGYAPGKGEIYTNFSTLTMFESYNSTTSDIHTWPPAGYSPVEISDYRQDWSIVFDKDYTIEPSNSYVSNGVTTYYLNPRTTIIQIEYNGKTYSINSDIIYSQVYNAISFEIPSELKTLLKDDNTIMYKSGENLSFAMTSIDITKNGQPVMITYPIEFFEAGEPEYIAVQEVSLNTQSLRIPLGTEAKLIATVIPNNATNNVVTWTSNDENVLKVDQNGNLKPLATGQVIIRAKAEERYSECLVEVYEEVTDLKIDTLEYEILLNESVTIDYTVLPDTATYKGVTFVSSDENIAEVSSSGKVTALATGEAIITVNTTNPNVKKEIKVRVYDERNDVTNIIIGDLPLEVYTGYRAKLDINFEPIDATTGKILTYSTSDENIATIDQNGNLITKNPGEVTIKVENQNGVYAEKKLVVLFQSAELKYRTHVQNVGWQKFVDAPLTSGTEGKGYRLEGIILDLESNLDGTIEYTTHVQNIGWQDYVTDENMSGTEGKSYRLEGIKIRLTGTLAEYYDVYYRVHIQNTGWLSWACNDETAGSSGYGFRLEGIQIALVAKGEDAPLMDPKPASTIYFQEKVNVIYSTHTENKGWQVNVRNGATQGAPGEHLRIEGIKIKTESTTKGTIKYSTHVEKVGWQDYVTSGEYAGTEGKALRLEAIKIELTDDLALKYDIYYRIYVEDKGWLDWASNGQEAGSTGFGKKLEGIEVLVKRKGSTPPGPTDNPCWNKN